MTDQTADAIATALIEEQHALESRATHEGRARHLAGLEKRGLANASSGASLRARALVPTAEAIKKIAAKLPESVRAIDEHVLAELVTHTALNAAVDGERARDGSRRMASLTTTARNIVTAIERHTRDEQLAKHAPRQWDRWQEALSSTQNVGFRQRSIDGRVESMREWARDAKPELAERLDNVRGLELDQEDDIELGCQLLNCFVTATKLVTTDEERTSRTRSRIIVRLTEGVAEWIESREEARAMLRPRLLPMIVEPREWTKVRHSGEQLRAFVAAGVSPPGPFTGGYLDNDKARVPFMRTLAPRGDEDTWECEAALGAVSVIQSTPFRINRRVLEVMRQAWENGTTPVGIGRVPPKYLAAAMLAPQPFPAHACDATGAPHPEWYASAEGRAVSRARSKVHAHNAKQLGRLSAFGRLMALADEYAKRERFWHVHNLDFRGRCYPVCSWLSPQGDQFNRGLIEFAEGKLMGDGAAKWLAIHGANLYAKGGIDKAPFDERIAWVAEHNAEIIEAARDPFGQAKAFWQDADGGSKAWPFLAFCFEWADYCKHGDKHITHLPVAVDGSNSGLQHLSAMVRDEDGATATNVAPSDEPQDIYRDIADIVTEELQGMRGDPKARMWLTAKVDRKICKHPVMTWAYSVTRQGAAEQIEAELDDRDEARALRREPGYLSFPPGGKLGNHEAAVFLAPIVLKAIEKRLPKAAGAMRFLVDVTRECSKEGMPLRWTTPFGLPVWQHYLATTAQKKRVYIGERCHQITLRVPKLAGEQRRNNSRKARDGVAPNFVHSMDGAHLMWTVLRAHSEGLADFAFIHDSFGTHATGVSKLAKELREAFVRLYAGPSYGPPVDRLADFLEEQRQRTVGELPELPKRGRFDLKGVRNSAYFFA